MTLIDDLKQAVREMPWFVMTVALLVVIGIGFNAEVVNSVDGDVARLCFGRVDTFSPQIDAGEQMVQQCAIDVRPGVTVLIGIDRYRMELTIPEAAVRARLAGVRMNLGYVEPVLRGIFGDAVREYRG